MITSPVLAVCVWCGVLMQVLTYVRCGHDASVLADLVPERQVPYQHKGGRFRVHPKLPDWLLVCRGRAGGVVHRSPFGIPLGPDSGYADDALGHAGVNQTVACLRQSFNSRVCRLMLLCLCVCVTAVSVGSLRCHRLRHCSALVCRDLLSRYMLTCVGLLTHLWWMCICMATPLCQRSR